MRAIIYKGLETKPSEEIKLKEGKLAPQLKHLGDCIAISGGQKCGKNYCVKKNDIITVRVYAGAPIAIVAAIIAVPFIVVGIVKLVNLYQDLKKLSQRKTINRKVESLPYLGGAENQLATGQTQPMIIGEHLFTPYFIDYPLSRISGTDGRDQFTYRVYELGFKEQVIKEIKAGKASLKKFALSEPQEGKFNLDATSSLYDADAFFEITQGGEFLTEEFNKKYYHLESGAILPKKKDGVQGELNFELPANSKYIEVAILFNGLIGYSDDGSKTSRSVEIKPQYSLDGSTWTTFAFDGATNNVFTRITQEQIRFTGRKTFTYAEIKNQTDIIKVRLLCPTVASTKQGYDDCYCVYVQAELFNVEESKKQNKFVAEKRLPDKQRALSTRLGLKIKATEDNQDKLGQINVITQGVAPTPAGNWINKTPTSNPASWLYEILTSETHPLSAITKDEIDLASFTELFSYCKDEGLEVNAVLLEARPKQQVLEMVLRLCNSVLYRNMTGQLQVATDKLNSQPIALFTSQNVLSTTIDKNLERKTDGVLINYIDSSLGYEQASHLVMHRGETETPDSVISTVQTEGITSYEQVVKFGRRLMATETLRPKTVKVQTSLEGVFYTPMSKVLLQTETLKTGKGNGEIKKVILDDNDLITHLELYDNFEFAENETNIIVVSLNRFDGNFTHTVANFEIASAEGKLIELATPILSSHANAPKKGDTLAYGVATKPIISEMIIAGVEENANGYTLTLVDYNEAIYDSGEIPEYKPSWASDIGDKPPATLPPLTFGDLETYVELEAPDTPTITAIAQKTSLRLSASVQDGAKNGIAKIEWSLKKDNAYELIGISRTDEFVYDLDDYYEVEDFASWRVKARVFNVNGKGTESLAVTINTDTYGTWKVLPPDGISAQSANRAANVTWQRKDKTPLGKDIYGISFYEIQISKDGTNWYKPAQGKTGKENEDDWKDGAGFLRLSGGSWSQSLPLTGQTLGLPENTTYYYRVRTRGIIDDYLSTWSNPVTAIALATGIGDIIEGAVTEQILAPDAVTYEKLNVLAVNKINSFVKGKNDYWTTVLNGSTKNCTIEVDEETGLQCGVLSSNLNGITYSNKFEVLPDDILEVNITFFKDIAIGKTHIGLQLGWAAQNWDCQCANYNTISKSWGAFNNTSNMYFLQTPGSTTRQTLKSYIVGYNVTPDKIPAPNLATACARMLPGQTKANLRILNYANAGTTTKLYILAPRVTNIASGQLLANQIITPSLSAINANVGEITAGLLRADIKAGESKPNVFLDLNTEEFRVGNKPSLEDSNHEDAEYLHWKPNQGLFLKLKNLIVDALASTIRGRFRVRGSTAKMAQSVFIVNPESTVDPETKTPANTTDIKTALRCHAGITGNLTGTFSGGGSTVDNAIISIKESFGVVNSSFHGTGKNDLSVVEESAEKGFVEVKILDAEEGDATDFGGVIFKDNGINKEVHNDRLQEHDWNTAKSWAEETRNGKAWRLPTRAELSLINPVGAWWTGETSGDEVYIWEGGSSELVGKQGLVDYASFFNASRRKETSQLVDGKLYIPEWGGTALEIIDTTTDTVTTLDNFFNASRERYTSQLVGTKIYIPEYRGTALEIIDTTNNTVTTYANFFNTSRYRRTSQIVEDKIYVLGSGDRGLDIIDTSNNTVTTDTGFFSASWNRYISHLVGTKIYIPQGDGTALQIIDTTNNTVTTRSSFFNASRFRISSQLVDDKIYIPEYKGTALEIIDTTNNTVTTYDNFFNTSRNRRTRHLFGTKIYITNGTALEIIDTTNNTVTTYDNFFNASRNRYTSHLVGTKIYIPQDGGTALEIIHLTANTLPVRNNTETQRRQVSSSSDGTSWTIRSTDLITAGQTFTSYFGLKLRFAGDTHKVGDYWRFEQDEMGAFSLQDSSGEEYVRAMNGQLHVKTLVGELAKPKFTGKIKTEKAMNKVIFYDENDDVVNPVNAIAGIEIGDVVWIKYEGYDKLHTVELLEAGYMIVNYEHCDTRGKGSLMLEDKTNVSATVELLTKWFNAPIGLGQDWVNVTGERSRGTLYTNSSGKLITVSMILVDGRSIAHIEVGGERVSAVDVYGAGASTVTLTANVPSGQTYELIGDNSVSSWLEFR